MWITSQSRWRYATACSVCLLMMGCGSKVSIDYSKVKLVEISGQITLDGKPLSGAAIVFEATDNTFSYARTDPSGNYTLMFNSEKQGVTLGEKVVRIRTRGGLGEADNVVGEEPSEEQTEGEESEDGGDAASQRQNELVPACYNTKSQLTVNVTTSTKMDFHLKSDCSVKSSS